MKAIVEINDTDLDSIHFMTGRKAIEWKNMTREEQIAIVNALKQFSELFQKFTKPE